MIHSGRVIFFLLLLSSPSGDAFRIHSKKRRSSQKTAIGIGRELEKDRGLETHSNSGQDSQPQGGPVVHEVASADGMFGNTTIESGMLGVNHVRYLRKSARGGFVLPPEFLRQDMRQGMRQIEIEDQIGSGGFGSVFRVYEDEEGTPVHPPRCKVALKIAMVRKEEGNSSITDEEREAYFMYLLNWATPGVNKIFSHVYTMDSVYIFTEYSELDFGVFFSSKMNSGYEIEETRQTTRYKLMMIRVLCYVLKAISAAHEKDVVHGDLKPWNILLFIDAPLDEARINATFGKLIDFGIAKLTSEKETTMKGTRGYMPPELLYGETKDRTPAGDMWAIGVMTDVILNDKSMFARFDSRMAEDCNIPDTGIRMLPYADYKQLFNHEKGLEQFRQYNLIEDERRVHQASGWKNWKAEALIKKGTTLDDVSAVALSLKKALIHGLLQFEPGQRMTAQQAIPLAESLLDMWCLLESWPRNPDFRPHLTWEDRQRIRDTSSWPKPPSRPRWVPATSSEDWDRLQRKLLPSIIANRDPIKDNLALLVAAAGPSAARPPG